MENFNVSTNIIRDQNLSINYIVTKNSRNNFDLIAANFKSNNRFQGIIGSYGTGKSTFLWAFEQNLRGEKNYFNSISSSYPTIESFEFIKLIGEYKSLSESLAKTLKIRGIVEGDERIEEKVLAKLGGIVKKNTKKNIGTVLIIDEFGKFLEYAVKNNPDKEVYFIQQLAEFFNDSKKLCLAISSLHQNFSSYGQTLNVEQFKEWEKVKGRLKEIPFNEPIDQLLYFASERNQFKNIKDQKSDKILELIKTHNVSDKKQSIDPILARKLYPLDYISAEIMAKSLQKYGQNERSLFSFLDIDESYSFKRFYNDYVQGTNKSEIYNLNIVFDYILEHYYYVISSNLNSDLTHWNSLKSALDQVDTRLDDKYIINGRQIVKTIGLLNIFTHHGANLDIDFISTYAKLALGIDNTKEIIDKLTSQKIISYKKYKHRYVFVDWTDLDIDFELQQAAGEIQETHNVAERVSEINSFHPILVKTHYFKTGTPRIFEYKFTNELVKEVPINSDAIINYVFSEDDISFVKKEEPIIYAVFKNTSKIKSLFFEIDKAKKVKEKNKEDRSAIKELEERIFYIEQELKDILIDEIYSDKDVYWIYQGEEIEILNRGQFVKQLNKILDNYYRLSPIFKSELVNKSKLSTPISTARKNLIRNLLENRDQLNIGFNDNKFPPEKTIYLSLLKSLGLHRFNQKSQMFELGAPNFQTEDPFVKSFKYVWEQSQKFIDESKTNKKSVKEFYDSLERPPLKLKRGFIDFWVPIFLIVKKEDYALFNENGYIPNLTIEVFDVMYKSPHKFSIKAFDISGVKLEVFNKYKTILNREKSESPTEQDFINTIKPFIIFTRSLNYYSLNTKNLTQQAINLRESIMSAKDPEKAFFEDFPKALNYSEAIEMNNNEMLEGFVRKMEDAINEVRSSYEQLVKRFESKIEEVLGLGDNNFPNYQNIMIERLESIDSKLLNSSLRNIYRRCTNPSTDRKLYLEGIAFAILGKGLEEIRDEEEEILYRDFETNYKRLIDLVDIHKLKETHHDDLVFGVTLVNHKGQDVEDKVIIPIKSMDKIQGEIQKINKSFNGIASDLKKAILIELLKNELNE